MYWLRMKAKGPSRALGLYAMNRAVGIAIVLVSFVDHAANASAPPFSAIRTAFISTTQSASPTRISLFHSQNDRIAEFPRGGGSDVQDAEEDESEEDDDGEEDDDEKEEYVVNEGEADEDEAEDEVVSTDLEDRKPVATLGVSIKEYDEPLVPSPWTSMLASFGVMMLARRIDLHNPTVVRIARAGFIGYMIALQLFLFYVRVQAKKANNRSPLELKSPLSSIMQSQFGLDKGGSGMIKQLASSFLSSTSTVVEYDLRQARNMQSGLIFNMLLMWFLHFKMEQVQPLLIQSITGLINMFYSPLFQVYILGRNLERPFVNPSLAGLGGSGSADDEQPDTSSSTEVEEENEAEEDDADNYDDASGQKDDEDEEEQEDDETDEAENEQ